jgi:hypothetical protein
MRITTSNKKGHPSPPDGPFLLLPYFGKLLQALTSHQKTFTQNWKCCRKRDLENRNKHIV